MKNFLLIIIVLVLISCREHPPKSTNTSISTLKWNLPLQHNKISKEIIPSDSQFVFEGISSTEVVEKCVWSFNYLFVDSSKKKAYLELDNNLKLKLLPDILKMDTTWIKEDIKAYLISKQEKIGNIQPVIIKTGGTDFSALILLTLDNNGNTISGIYLNIYDGSGPVIDLDSTMLLPPFTRCYFDKNKINFYLLSAWVNKYKDIPATIDSVSYQSIIDTNGNISIQKLDSVRYKRNYVW